MSARNILTALGIAVVDGKRANRTSEVIVQHLSGNLTNQASESVNASAFIVTQCLLARLPFQVRKRIIDPGHESY
jgi:hypothetical protein